ncbi:hypothetical protein JOQ06_004570, partial [Pogonophryne albipinna]
QTGSLCGQGVSDESRVLNTQRSQRATLTQQTERLCAAEDARHAAVLERYINKNQGRPESLDEEDRFWDKVLLAKTCAADRDRKPNWSSSFRLSPVHPHIPKEQKTPAGARKKGSAAAANMLPPLVPTPPTARLKGELNLGRCKTPS